MTHEETIKKYLVQLESGDLETMLSLFSPDAVVNSPLYGQVLAVDFYKDLFADTSKSVITLKHVLSGDQPGVAAGHFQYDWTMKDGTPTTFECVDMFYFAPDGKIREMTIIYDTAKLRSSFEKMKK